jgi:GT2 family glycosyltransferase
MPQEKLTLVILNYNSKFWLKKCLASLKTHYLDKTKTGVKTIVVDNHSTDDSLKMVRADFPWVEVVELEKNLGFSAGNNAVLKQINSSYVMLLNSDIEFNFNTHLDLLINYMEEDSEIAVATPKINLADGSLDWACHRGEPTPWASLTYFTGLDKLFPQSKHFGSYHLTYKNLDKPHFIDACSGAAMMVRVKYMNEVGLLDEQFFMYGEDLDWCKRFRDAGYKIGYFPQVEIIHHKYKSGIQTESPLTALQSKRYFYNTMLLYYDKHYKDKYPKIVRWLLRLFLFIKKGGM